MVKRVDLWLQLFLRPKCSIKSTMESLPYCTGQTLNQGLLKTHLDVKIFHIEFTAVYPFINGKKLKMYWRIQGGYSTLKTTKLYYVYFIFLLAELVKPLWRS